MLCNRQHSTDRQPRTQPLHAIILDLPSAALLATFPKEQRCQRPAPPKTSMRYCSSSSSCFGPPAPPPRASDVKWYSTQNSVFELMKRHYTCIHALLRDHTDIPYLARACLFRYPSTSGTLWMPIGTVLPLAIPSIIIPTLKCR